MTVKPIRTIYQLKITLEQSKPPIWRRVLVPSNFHLGKLHQVIQIAMGWTDTHLHLFNAHQVLYAPAEDDEFEMGIKCKDETKYKLSQILTKEKEKLHYEYDFGDGWRHIVVLEKILPFDLTTVLPSCLTGRRACPPENCGGIWGYADLLEIITNTAHPDHEEMMEWVSGEFDPVYFNVTEVNELFGEVF